MYCTGANPYLLVSAIKYAGGEWSVAGSGRGIVETMAALEGLEGLIREKTEQDRWSHAQLFDFLKLSYPGVQGFSIRSLQRFCQEKNILLLQMQLLAWGVDSTCRVHGQWL